MYGLAVMMTTSKNNDKIYASFGKKVANWLKRILPLFEIGKLSEGFPL